MRYTRRVEGGSIGRYLFLLSLLSLLSASCEGDERCRAWGGSSGTSSFFQCGDRKERTVRCDRQASDVTGKTTCRCALDGVAGKTFETADLSNLDTRDGAISLANANCGWRLSR
jgi:hypothetical protein